VSHEGPRPGRKIIIWISPGWLLIFGPKHNLDAKTEQQVFGNIVDTSTQLREARITLYSVDPLGTADIGERTWEAYPKGVTKPSQVRMEDLALGVIATQSGGLVLDSGNDIAAQLKKCVADTEAYYEISFGPAITDRPNEYHQLEVHVAKPGLTTRTRQGYYSQPSRAGKVTAESEKFSGAEDDRLAHKPSTESAARADTSDQSYYANAHPYVDLPNDRTG
jgi:VWFA-related protein